jgi:hypothetical protein
MQSKMRAKQNCSSRGRVGRLEKELRSWASQDLTLLLESADMRVVNPGKSGHMLLPSRD